MFEIAIDVLTIAILVQGKFVPDLPGLANLTDIPPALENLEADMNEFKALHRGVYQVSVPEALSSAAVCPHPTSCVSRVTILTRASMLLIMM